MRYINVAEYLQNHFEMHNAKYSNDPDMHYRTFPDNLDLATDEKRKEAARSRNCRAKRRIEELLLEHIPKWYGKYTYNQCRLRDWPKVKTVLDEAEKHHYLSLCSQSEDGWMLRKLIEEKMVSKSREFRARKKSSSKTSSKIDAGMPQLTADFGVGDEDMQEVISKRTNSKDLRTNATPNTVDQIHISVPPTSLTTGHARSVPSDSVQLH